MQKENIKKFVKTEIAAYYFDISIELLKKMKKNNTFKLNTHYVQPTQQLLRWNLKELEKWFYRDSIDTVDKLLIENILK